MDGAQIFHLYIAFAKENFLQRVGGREENEKISMWMGMKFSLVRILVEVASIQMRILKTEVEQGFMRTVFGHELVGPKR
jgi:hypothetical protein